jgi:GDP-L-fucose synthase
MKVLITGASGFLGTNLQHHLRKPREHGCLEIDDSRAHYSIIPVSSKEYDLRDSYSCKQMLWYYKPDVVIHAAGSVGGILANQQNPGKFMYDNLAMGMNMLERTRQYRDRFHANWTKFIMLGTVCAYPKYTPTPFSESYLWEGYPEETNAPYGIAKKTLMKLGETYHEQYGLDVINLIPVNMYGPHDHFNVTSSHVIPALILKFYNAMKHGCDSVECWGTGAASREFLYASDCAEAIERAIWAQNVGPEPINIGTGKEITIFDLVNEIADQMGFEGDIVWDKSKPDGQPRRCLNVHRAQERLGFTAKTDFQTGLKQTIEWFLQQQQENKV